MEKSPVHSEASGTASTFLQQPRTSLRSLASVLDPAEIRQVARNDGKIGIAPNLGHPRQVARRHVHIADGNDFMRIS